MSRPEIPSSLDPRLQPVIPLDLHPSASSAGSIARLAALELKCNAWKAFATL